MKISIAIPSRNNLKYFKWAFESIQKNKGNHEVYICAADDASTDGTAEYFKQLAETIPEFSYITNEGPERVGLTILYDRIINELVKTEIAMIYHADMYLAPGALDAIEKHIYCNCRCHTTPNMKHFTKCCTDNGKPVNSPIVSLTRIEPPLHPDGPEKCIWDCGIEPEEFDEDKLLQFVSGENQVFRFPEGHTTEGVFAPWAFWVDDFKEIGGHDPLFAPQSKEDSDIFNRFHLNGIKFVQTWEGFVYHMTCRGSRYNPTLTTPGVESTEWKLNNEKSTRNFIRKWGHMVMHDEYMKPIVPPRYNVGIIIHGGIPLLKELEPWCDTVYIDDTHELIIDDYIEKEQPNTKFDLRKKIINTYGSTPTPTNDVVLTIHQADFSPNCRAYLYNLSLILEKNSRKIQPPAEFELGRGFTMKVNRLENYVNSLIKV